jgi:predicted HicB family RNase H-like nuclease
MPKRNYSRAELDARNRYNKKAYDSLSVRFPKGKLAAVRDAANMMGESLNGYIITAINLRMRLES